VCRGLLFQPPSQCPRPCHRAVALFGISGALLVLECAVGGLVDPALVVFASSVSEYWNGVVA
jgi:hypothetical protein